MQRIIRAVLFDLGGTLWQPVTPIERERVLAEAGLRAVRMLRAWGHSPLPEPIGLAQAVATAAEAAERQAARTTLAVPDKLKVLADVLEAFGLRLSPAACAPLRAAFGAGMAAPRTLFSGVAETLAALQARGLRLALVSDQIWGEASHLEIERSGLVPFFETTILSCKVGWMKPHPLVFQAALSQLKVHPEEAVMVGDNLEADVKGAQALGIAGVWKRSPGDLSQPHIQPEATITRIDELVDLLPRIGTLAR